jgi:hypothetical protein
MFFKYAPEGVEPRQWTFAPDRLMASEAEAIEKVTHLTYEQFGVALIKGSVSARRALLWVLLKREEPTLRNASVDPAVGSMSLEYEPHELRDMRSALEDNRDLSDQDRAAAMVAIDEMIADAETEAPKAPENVVALNG